MLITPGTPQAIVGWISAGLLGLITGSFLNAVIHRLPRGISLLDPSRSFCPGCERQIPWHENLPVASWLFLRGRCSGCAMPISLRYPLVEILTAGLYLAAWGRFGLPEAVAYWILLSLLVAATFIDIDHLIIPDEITLGGAATGVVCATLLPGLVGATVWWTALPLSLAGAAFGYLVLWGVVEGGKKAFGSRTIRPNAPEALEITLEGEVPMMLHGGDAVPLAEFFHRASDRIEACVPWLEIDGERIVADGGSGPLVIDGRFLTFAGRSWGLEDLADTLPVRMEITEITLPREAMGFGDVKFLACIGAFLGWKGVLFSLFFGSVTGAAAGLLTLTATRGRSGGKIPFGPYLAFGAVVWVLAGPRLLDLYAGWLRSEAAFFLLRSGLPV